MFSKRCCLSTGICNICFLDKFCNTLHTYIMYAFVFGLYTVNHLIYHFSYASDDLDITYTAIQYITVKVLKAYALQQGKTQNILLSYHLDFNPVVKYT